MLKFNGELRLTADELSRHPFLTKNVNQFKAFQPLPQEPEIQYVPEQQVELDPAQGIPQVQQVLPAQNNYMGQNQNLENLLLDRIFFLL